MSGPWSGTGGRGRPPSMPDARGSRSARASFSGTARKGCASPGFRVTRYEDTNSPRALARGRESSAGDGVVIGFDAILEPGMAFIANPVALSSGALGQDP